MNVSLWLRVTTLGEGDLTGEPELDLWYGDEELPGLLALLGVAFLGVNFLGLAIVSRAYKLDTNDNNFFGGDVRKYGMSRERRRSPS